METLKGLNIDSKDFNNIMKNYTIISIHAIYKKEAVRNILTGFEYIICNNVSGKNIYFKAEGLNSIFIIKEVEILK